MTTFATGPVRRMALVGGGVFAISAVSHFRTPLLPEIGAELAMSAGQLGLVTTTFAAGRLVTDLPAGLLVDRLGIRRVFVLAGVTLLLGGVVFATAPLPAWVLVAAALVGSASALANTTGMTYFSTVATATHRGRSMALFSASLLGGQALGPTVGGLLADLGTWRTSMLVAASIGLVLAGVATVAGGPWRQTTRPPASGERKDPAAGAGRLRRRHRFALYAIPFSGMFMLGALPQTIIHIIGVSSLGLSTSAVGLALGAGGLCRMVASPAGGWLADRVSRKAALVPALFGKAIGVGVLAVATTPATWMLSIVMISLFSFTGVIAATVLGDLGGRHGTGRRLGGYRFVGDTGLLVGPAVTGVVFEWFGQAAAVSSVAVLLVAVGVLVAVVLPETGPRGAPHGR